jgi:hypothetical protein
MSNKSLVRKNVVQLSLQKSEEALTSGFGKVFIRMELSVLYQSPEEAPTGFFCDHLKTRLEGDGLL